MARGQLAEVFTTAAVGGEQARGWRRGVTEHRREPWILSLLDSILRREALTEHPSPYWITSRWNAALLLAMSSIGRQKLVGELATVIQRVAMLPLCGLISELRRVRKILNDGPWVHNGRV
ncbi:hypothetical protein GOP47_0020568 [Adiantum capillus-veneris]|uniref:Uncharacterized protein n=1 Tax=Adiantum capillus-veneris TaxID=13818 RepID=A0A9D4U9E4_ADICA|nr:hypothetical protein GOP47_0020568 [Adiantum capillus-veneris]